MFNLNSCVACLGTVHDIKKFRMMLTSVMQTYLSCILKSKQFITTFIKKMYMLGKADQVKDMVL